MTGKGFWICCAPWIKYVSMFDYSFIGITACAQTEFLSTWIYLLSDMRPAYCQFTIYKKHFLQKKNTQNQCWFLFFLINQVLHGKTTYCPIIREWEQRREPPPPRWVNFRGELIDDRIITYWSKLRSTFTYTHYQKNIFRKEKKIWFASSIWMISVRVSEAIWNFSNYCIN